MYKFVKRVFDFFSALIAFILLLPVFLLISILIKLDSSGPVFFKHKRIGYNGNILYLYKFRTMVPNAEELIKKFSPEQKKEWEQNYKLDNDPRITKVGKFLRRTSLDELPQLINIMCGNLSVVGPRPVIQQELELYGQNKNKFLSVKPGLTGYWACHGRSQTTYEERMNLELYYVDHASIWLDIKIILKTVISVFKEEGAK